MHAPPLATEVRRSQMSDVTGPSILVLTASSSRPEIRDFHVVHNSKSPTLVRSCFRCFLEGALEVFSVLYM
jgi:hypothetical protein